MFGNNAPQTNYGFDDQEDIYQPGHDSNVEDPEVDYEEEETEDDDQFLGQEADQGEDFQDEDHRGMDPFGQDQQQQAMTVQQQQDQQFQMQQYQQQQQQQQQYAYYQQQQQKQQQQEQALARRNKQQEEEERKKLRACLGLTFLLLFMALIGVGVLLYLWLSDDDDNTTKIFVNATNTTNTTDRDTSLSTSPTPSPTPAPQAQLVPEWFTRSGNTLSSDQVGSSVGFGEEVAIVGNFLVAASPSFSTASGRIAGFSRSSSQGTFSNIGVASEGLSENFGSDIDMCMGSNGIPFLLVGASRTEFETTQSGQTFDARYGAAYAFSYNGVEWSTVGDVIRSPTESFTEANGLLGDAVACANTQQRVAVASPSSSKDFNTQNTGRVFTMELQGATWTSITSSPLEGAAQSYFGTDIDMSSDGNRLVVGAPGASGTFSAGEVFIYDWNSGTDEWDQVLKVAGTATEKLGTTTAIINNAGTQVAFGGPLFNNDRGVVRVYEKSGNTFTKRGNDIVGSQVGEKVGQVLCGRAGRVAIGTETGSLRVYDFDDSTNDWVPLANSPDTGDAIRSCAMSDAGTAVAVGLSSDEVIVFDLINGS